MERFGTGSSLAALIAMLAVSCPIAHAEPDAPLARGARLGLAVAPLDDTWRKSNGYHASGVMVVGVDPIGRAARSGIIAGDVLVSLADRTLREPSDLGYAAHSLPPGQGVSVVVARDGGRSIKIFELAPAGGASAVAVEPAVASSPPAADSSAALAFPSAVAAAPSASDISPSPAVVVDAAAAADSALLPAAVAQASAAADSATPPAAASTSFQESESAAGQKSDASVAAPALAATGSSGSPSAAGTAAAAPLAIAAPAGVAVASAATAIAEPGSSPTPAIATADSSATPPASVESAPAELGVVGQSLTPDLATALGASGAEGILILEVAAASPADRSGLRAGDIILTVGGQPVSDMGELQRAAAASSQPIPISTLRLGKPRAEFVSLDGPPLTPYPPPSQEQLLMDLRDEVRSLRREVEGLRKKLGK